MSYSKFADEAVAAAKQAGIYQMSRFSSSFSIDLKSDKDLVTEVDKGSEEIIVNHLLGCFADHSILAEEGTCFQLDSGFRWIIDPIDGTTNFAHGFPWFCSSIALEHNGELVVGVIYNPVYDELFTAIRGQGAYLNGARLSVSHRSPLSNTLLGTGFPYDCATDPLNNFDNFMNFQKKARGIRRAGAAALDLAYVAAGRLDGFWELKLKPWDVAAGIVLVIEAGGTVTSFAGTAFNMTQGHIVASNGLIHSEIVTHLQNCNQ